jgi:hypothetical protein
VVTLLRRACRKQDQGLLEDLSSAPDFGRVHGLVRTVGVGDIAGPEDHETPRGRASLSWSVQA